MNLFYTPDIAGEFYSLNEEESRHCRKVLRLHSGDAIHLTDGNGTLYEAEITDTSGKMVAVRVINRIENYGKRDYRLHLAVAPTKNIDRYEWFLEKATEIGIDEITPLICEHSERRQVRNDRLMKVIIAGVKQSLKAYCPVLYEPISFNGFIAQQKNGSRFIAHLEENDPVLLQSVYRSGEDAVILIGPEGDFSEPELLAARQAGYRCVSLGSSRLRTETAAVVAGSTVLIANQQAK